MHISLCMTRVLCNVNWRDSSDWDSSNWGSIHGYSLHWDFLLRKIDGSYLVAHGRFLNFQIVRHWSVFIHLLLGIVLA
jgi:hypothetical protein